MRNHVRFRSTAFTPGSAGEDAVNPGRYGRALATWISTRLSSAGFPTSEPVAEDWGWLLDIPVAGERYRVACGNVDGTTDQWLVWVESVDGFFAKLLGGGNSGSVQHQRICAAIMASVESEPSVSDVEWFTVDPRGQELDHGSDPDLEIDDVRHA
jgi:hypothetical protein